MPLLEFQNDPTPRQLRQFAGINVVALPLLGWLMGIHAGGMALLAASGLLAAGVSFLRPEIIRPVFIALCLLALPIGLIISEVLLLLIYFGLFFPVGILFRMMGRDALRLKKDPHARSYWQNRRRPQGPKSWYRQF